MVSLGTRFALFYVGLGEVPPQTRAFKVAPQIAADTGSEPLAPFVDHDERVGACRISRCGSLPGALLNEGLP